MAWILSSLVLWVLSAARGLLADLRGRGEGEGECDDDGGGVGVNLPEGWRVVVGVALAADGWVWLLEGGVYLRDEE